MNNEEEEGEIVPPPRKRSRMATDQVRAQDSSSARRGWRRSLTPGRPAILSKSKPAKAKAKNKAKASSLASASALKARRDLKRRKSNLGLLMATPGPNGYDQLSTFL